MTETDKKIMLKRPPKSRAESPGPLYLKVKYYITDRIRSGQWSPDTRIPSENDLAQQFRVSRMTVNRALRELAAEGVLVRIQGVGTFVAKPRPRFALMEIRNIADEIRAWGGVYSGYVHLLREERASAEIAGLMEMIPGSPVYHILMVHKDRGIPIQLADRYVNPAVAPDFLKQDFTQMTPNAYLMQVAPVSEAEQVIEAVTADEEQCRLLEITASEPCLSIRRRTWSHGSIATRSRFICPGSRYWLWGKFRPETG